MATTTVADSRSLLNVSEPEVPYGGDLRGEELLKVLRSEMEEAAEMMEFERAAVLRDQYFQVLSELDETSPGKGGKN